MSFEWKRMKIGDLCDQFGAELQTGPFGSQLHSYDYKETGIPVVPTEAIDDGKINPDVLPRISSEKANELSRHLLRQGDILFARRGAQATGKTAIVRKSDEGAICGTGAIRLRIEKAKSIAFPSFLATYLSGKETICWIRHHAIGATMPNLNEGIIRSIPILLPSLQEQKAIVHILGTLDDKIELNSKINETLEAMAKALFKSWFVDFDPVRAKVEGRSTGLPAEISDLFPDSFEDSELGEIPRGWSVAPVGEVVECVGGSTPSTSEPAYWDGGKYFWVTPKDLSSLPEPFLLDTAKKITADGVQRISSGILPVGTILLSSRAPVGYIAAACVPVSINQGFIALKGNALMPSAYLLNWCLSNVQQFKDRASGTTFAEISKAAFRPIPLLAPSDQVARIFSEKAQILYDRVVSNMKQSNLLSASRDTLLPKLISGELRIPDAEKILEKVGV